MKQDFIHTKVKTILRQVQKADGKWRILLEAFPVYEEGKIEPTRTIEDPNIIVTTPIFEDKPLRVCSNGQEVFAVKRDEHGLIMCSSDIDRAACMYADQIRKIRQSEYDKDNLYTKEERKLVAKFKTGDKDFVEYFEECIERLHPNGSKSVMNNWRRTTELFRLFRKGEPLPFCDLNVTVCNDFKNFLCSRPNESRNKRALASATIAQYISVLKTALHQAFIEEYIPTNLASQLRNVHVESPKRETLSMEEVKMLGRTPCHRPVVKRAALFTLLTGVRHCDVYAMKWKQIKSTPDGYRLDFVQQKTGVPSYVPLSEQAYALCGVPDDPELLVFAGLPHVTECNVAIKKWTKAAGLDCHITYHCFRHTFATLLLQCGVNLFTIKQLLGHTRVTTTEMYSHIVDSAKQQAAQAIVLDTSKKESSIKTKKK